MSTSSGDGRPDGEDAADGAGPVARAAVLIAGAAGLLHAAWSAYWAVGGRWLLPTVGAWAVELAEDAPFEAGLLLAALALVKAAAAIIPVGVAMGIIPGARYWRMVSWVGGILLAGYGGLNVVVSSAVLLGFIRPDGGYDEPAMIGHALLWDPLFLIWGLALVVWLTVTGRAGRRRGRA
jgi:hypothetical protein